SLVFSVMVFGTWIESKPADDPSIFKVILNIIHSKFNKVPKVISSGEELNDLLVLCDKYGMTALAKPWAGEWLALAHSQREEL
ncbi:hypothetical protein QBC36DRAFT_153713, partial [Triangularia setosa]